MLLNCETNPIVSRFILMCGILRWESPKARFFSLTSQGRLQAPKFTVYILGALALRVQVTNEHLLSQVAGSEVL